MEAVIIQSNSPVVLYSSPAFLNSIFYFGGYIFNVELSDEIKEKMKKDCNDFIELHNRIPILSKIHKHFVLRSRNTQSSITHHVPEQVLIKQTFLLLVLFQITIQEDGFYYVLLGRRAS